jgi:putative oxidoreductase
MNRARLILPPVSIDGAIFLIRLWLGAMMIYHGFQKLFFNMSGFIDYLAKANYPFPTVLAYLAAGSEFFGGLLIVAGFLTQYAAALVLITMLVAGFVAHGSDPFAKKELPLTYALISLSLMLSGSGKWSVETLRFSSQKKF